MDSKNEDSDDFEYQSAFAALDELRLGNLKPFFKEQCLQDDTLSFMNSEEELRNFLIKELGLPFGNGFKFSRLWFTKYHKRAETLDAHPPETYSPPQGSVQASVKSGDVTTFKNVQRKEGINGSPFNQAPTSLTNDNFTQLTSPAKSHQVIETTIERSDTAITLRQTEKENETAVQSALKEATKMSWETASSVSMLTQELGENQQDLTGVQHDRSNQNCQSAAANGCKKGSVDQTLTTCAQNRGALLERLEDDDQAQKEACKTEDHQREDSRTYRRAVSDHKAQDSDGTISFSKPQEETIRKDAPPLSVNKGFLEVDSVVVDYPEDETIKFDTLDISLNTAKDWTGASEHVVLSWSDGTATESQENTTTVDVANELKEEDINGSPLDVTPADFKNVDIAPIERPSISDQVIEITSRMSDTDKFTMRQPEKVEQAVQSISSETAKSISALRPVENHLKEEPLGNKQDSTTVQNERSNQMCQSGLEKLFIQTTPKTDSIIVTDGTNDEPDNRHFTPQMSPKSPHETFKDGQTLEVIQETSKGFRDENRTIDSCISGSMKLLIKRKEPENGQKDLLSSSPSTVDAVAMTANKDLTPSVDDVDIFIHQTDQQVKDLQGSSFGKLLSEHKENDAPTLAVNKRFLGVDSVAVDHYQDETSEISKVDKYCKTTVNQADISISGLVKNDSDSFTQEDKKELDVKEEDETEDLLGRHTSLIHENPTTMMTTSVISDAARPLILNETKNSSFDKMQLGKLFPNRAEPVISKEASSGSEEMWSAKLVPSHDAKESSDTSLKQEITVASSNQGIAPEVQSNLLETENFKEVSEPVLKCTPRPFGVKGKDTSYPKGFVLDAEENREVEFKSLTSAQPSLLPWKIMDKAKKFICACLNADRKGIIYFGVGDCQEQNSRFKRGEILGLYVEDVIDDITKAFQFVLDDHIKSDDGPLKKGGDQNCVKIEFIPVTSEGNRTNLCVVEIEVSRDWKWCKDNVYYSKCWAEKRGVKTEKDLCTKKLSDFYKLKDDFDDVAIRTNGASSSVKQHEVNRQVKAPLTAKYKEWKRETKHGTSESLEGPIPDDSDAKRFSTLVRDRLHDLNSKDFGYILIANKLPPQYRGTPHLAFLQNIPWLAVFDLFDAASKKDGLHYVCNETTDAPRAKLRSLDEFKEASSDWISGNDFTLPTRGTTWILNNEEMQKGDWIKCCRDCVYRALSAYKHRFPPGRLLCVFLGLSESAIKEMVDIMECCFSIFGDSASNYVTIISESKIVADAFIKSSSLHKELRECSVSEIPWSLLKEIVREMVGPTKFEERGATTELPYFNGQLKEVLNKVIYSWDDLEVYIPNPRLPSSAEDIEKARNAFYKGAQASQTNLFHNHCIQRTLEEETNLKIGHALKSLSKSGKDLGCHVKTVTVPYEPGSGATTLCRRILWNKRKDYRCAVVKAITPATDYQIEQLQGIIYDEKNINVSLPALVLVDNFPENETRRLTEKIGKRQTKCVILSTFPIGKLSANADFDITSLQQLDEKEMSLVKDILINITSDSERRRGAEEVLEREKRFIWFGLELFGRDYDKIEKRLQSHINSTLNFLGDSQEIHEMVLNFCCFLHYYSDGRTILPHSVASDFLYEASDEAEEECGLMQHIHKIFGGLLLEGFNETNGYYGWRPAHSLVSEVVKSRISIEGTAILLLEKIHNGKAYVNKFLKEQVFKLFLDRKRISDTVVLEDLAKGDDSIDSDLETEVVGFYEVRTRYSPLIVDILEGGNGIRGALKLLITICQKASQTEEKSYAWQQLARFMGYEMRAKKMDSKDNLHLCLYSTMNKEGDVKLSMPETCIEAAHVAVDIAINQQPKYSHHYVTKGVLYLLQLRDFKPEERPNLPCSLPAVIDICRKALEVYDKALSTTNTLNHYSMIGKIQAMVSLLEVVKGLPCFRLESERFTRYLKKLEIPREMEDTLKQEEHSYVQELSTRTLALFNELFRDIKLRQMTTYDENEIKGLSNAKIRASKLRRTFYEVTGFDRSELSDVDVPMLSSPLTRDAPALYPQIVQDILFKHDETPYSSWANLGERDVSLIYNLLKPLCLRGFGNQDDLLICCKACLRMNERPSVDELEKIVNTWVDRYPSSEWAHLFNYMIHFPIPNGSLAAFSHSAKLSIKKCDKLVRGKTGIGFRKSGAEYFLGKGIGLYAIVTSHEFRWLETKRETKTDFWRSREISEKLERVCGQKDVHFKGVITYQGIQLRFDDTRYPNESKDDLWFYIGFSVAGPYAYDPVDNDTYAILSRKTSECILSIFQTFEAANHKDNNGTTILISKRARFREPKYSAPKRSQEPGETKAENLDVPSGDVSGFPCRVPVYQEEKPISSSMPHNLNALPSGCRDNPSMIPNTTLSSSSEGFSTGMLSWPSVNNLQKQPLPKWSSYASALQLGSSRREEQVTKPTTKQQQNVACNSLPTKGRNWKSVLGARDGGTQKREFKPRYVDKRGKIHHGSWVLGAEKSKECSIHTKRTCDITSTSRCSFAHSWRGDTLQYVCTMCTGKNEPVCRERNIHKTYIWNLGPYYAEDGTIWKDLSQ